MLTLNGTGQLNNAVSSGAIRTGAASIVWAGDVVIGASLAADGTNGQVVISSTGSNTMEIRGPLMGGGNLQKQGGGNLLLTNANNTATGTTQIGNGAMTVAAGSSMSTGDLVMLQSSNNSGIALNLDNAMQNIGNLSNDFTQGAGTTSLFTEFINLGTLNMAGTGGQLNIKQTRNAKFGFGVVSNLQGTIQGPGSISLDAASTAALTLNGPNLYDGGTTINGGTLTVANGSNGSATGPATFNSAPAGTVTINSGGNLASGQATVFGASVAFGAIAGPVVANSGGNLFPGGGGTVGSLTVGGLDAHSGSSLNFDLVGGLAASRRSDHRHRLAQHRRSHRRQNPRIKTRRRNLSTHQLQRRIALRQRRIDHADRRSRRQRKNLHAHAQQQWPEPEHSRYRVGAILVD